MSGREQKKKPHSSSSPAPAAKDTEGNPKHEQGQLPPVYWSVIHHKNVHEGLKTNNVKSSEEFAGHKKSKEKPPVHDSVPEVIHERQPLVNTVSTRSDLTGYESTSHSRPTSPLNVPLGYSSGSEVTPSRKWSRVKESVDSKELFIKHIPDMVERGTERRTEQKSMKWSDLDEMEYEFTLRECIFLFLALLAMGALAFSFMFEKWSLIDSIYFTTVLLTTVGYGDISPTTPGGKLFASVFALGGIVVLGLALGVVGSQLVEAEISFTEKAQSKTSRALESAFVLNRHEKPNDNGTETTSLARSISTASLDSAGSNSTCDSVSVKPYETSHWRAVIRRHLPGFVPILVGGLIMSLLENWRFVDAIYYSIVTATTIGFGDLSPQHPTSRLAAIVFVPIVVAAMGYILGNLATFIVEKRRSKYMKKLWSKELKVEDIIELDEAHDGGVNELEYIKFMLIAMHKIDASLFDDLRNQFEEMDVTGDGLITEKDLKMMAMRKMHKISHKLKLRAYKKKLTKQIIPAPTVMFESALKMLTKTQSSGSDQ